MAQDYRYSHVKSIWAAGDLKSFNKIFTIVPKYVISDDLGVNYGRFSKKTNDPSLLSMREILELADLTGIEFKSLVALVIMDIEEGALFKSKYK
jgi:hypothetical protein